MKKEASFAKSAGPATTREGERIAKRIARAGVCSRREAEAMIEGGRVTVNGQKITSPALNVTDADKITVNGQPLAGKEPIRLWRFNKPDGCLTTNSDPQERRTVFDVIPDHLPRVVTVGRLDYTTEGLLLLTNDGDLSRWLEHPSTGWTRMYRVRLHGRVTQSIIDQLAAGVTIERVHYRPATLEIESTKGLNSWALMTLTEGKNREVKTLLNFFGLEVARLIRVSFGPFQLGKLQTGAVEEVPQRIIREHCPAFFE